MGRMKNNSFSRAMNQISAQAEAEREKEARVEQRRKIFSKVRGVGLFLFGAGLLASGFYYRAEVQQYISDKCFAAKPQVDGETGEALAGLQEHANKRDSVLEEITK